jgi:ABC-type polysaccharide/polyol phosphate export permease
VLNGAVFSALGIVVSFLAKNHADVPRFSNYFIMPMAYLCNTFFSTDSIPHGVREFIAILPLSQTSRMVRAIAMGDQADLRGILILLIYLAVFMGIGLYFVYKKKNL